MFAKILKMSMLTWVLLGAADEASARHHHCQQSDATAGQFDCGGDSQVPDAATCSTQGTPRLREVHVCVDRDLNARACCADSLRAARRASSVIVAPVR